MTPREMVTQQLDVMQLQWSRAEGCDGRGSLREELRRAATLQGQIDDSARQGDGRGDGGAAAQSDGPVTTPQREAP